MKTKDFNRILALMLVLVMSALVLTACGGTSDDPFDNATYKKDTTLGEGAKTVTVTVTVNENKVVFTLKTDGATLADALLETGLAEGDMGAYGLYIKKVNGITADYDVDASYWSLYVDGKAASTGADGFTLAGGESFELIYTK